LTKKQITYLANSLAADLVRPITPALEAP